MDETSMSGIPSRYTQSVDRITSGHWSRPRQLWSGARASRSAGAPVARGQRCPQLRVRLTFPPKHLSRMARAAPLSPQASACACTRPEKHALFLRAVSPRRAQTPGKSCRQRREQQRDPISIGGPLPGAPSCAKQKWCGLKAYRHHD
jgi:hypothetical protein